MTVKRIFAILVLAALTLTLTGCGETKAEPSAPAVSTEAATEPAAPDFAKVYEDMSDKLPEMILLDDATMQTYCGINKEDCLQAIAAVNLNGLETDEIWLIEAKDEAAMDELEAAAQLRLKMKAEETETYAPAQYEVVKKAQLIREGTLLALIVTPEAEALADVFRTAIGK